MPDCDNEPATESGDILRFFTIAPSRLRSTILLAECYEARWE